MTSLSSSTLILDKNSTYSLVILYFWKTTSRHMWILFVPLVACSSSRTSCTVELTFATPLMLFARSYRDNVSTITSWMFRVIFDGFPTDFPTSRPFEWSLATYYLNVLYGIPTLHANLVRPSCFAVCDPLFFCAGNLQQVFTNTPVCMRQLGLLCPNPSLFRCCW